MAELSGEFSRRQLSSPASALRREARRQERYGNLRGAAELNQQSSLARLQNPGFASAEEQTAIQRYQARAEDQVANERRRSLREQQGVTEPATGNTLSLRQSLYREMQSAGRGGITDDMRNRAASLGVTKSGFDQAVAKLPQAQVDASQPVALKPAFVPPGVNFDQDSNGVHDSIQSAPTQREGRINGQPASQVISSLRQSISQRDGADPISGKPVESPLVRQAIALRDANRILESRNTATSIGSFSENEPVIPVGGNVPAVTDAASPESQAPTFEQLTPKAAAEPKKDRFAEILDETQAKVDAEEKKKAEDRLFAGTSEQQAEEKERQKVSSLRAQYAALPLEERQKRQRAESARRRSVYGY